MEPAPNRNRDKAWEVYQYEGGWFWHDDGGIPYGPFDKESEAWDALGLYDAWYETLDEEYVHTFYEYE
jgi:hypothetical protein